MLACDTQIYKDTYMLTKELYRMTRKFERDYKASIARRIETVLLDMQEVIITANIDKQRRAQILLTEFTPLFETLQFLINLAVDSKQMTLRQQSHIARFMQRIGKQATNWRRSAEITANKRKKPNGSVNVEN